MVRNTLNTLMGLKLQYIMLVLLMISFSAPLWADVRATTDRTVVGIDETITLNIQSKNGSGSPDLDVLKKDFQIMGQSQSQNYSFINGHASSTQTWTVTLLPKSTGELTIPAIKVGNEQTKPIPLVIQKQSTTPALDGKEVFLKLHLSTEDSVYVQQQILLTVQLYHRIRLANATLTDLELNNAVIEKLGNDSNYTKVIGKNRYNVIERQYAIYPQQSGTLTIPSLTFSGNKEIGQSFSLFSRPGRQLISRTEPVTIKVKPIPSSYTGQYWLPAESVVLESEILEDTSNIKAGEAITRHIIIRATNLLGSQLPAISMASNSDYKTYPDKEKLNNQLVNGKVIGSRKDTIAIIPLHPGPFTLPEIKVSWWNTITNKQETAILPARTLNALPNPDMQTQPAPKPPAPVTKPQPVQSVANSTNSDNSIPETTEKVIEKNITAEPHFTKNRWFWVSMGLLVLWLITLILWLSARKKQTAPEVTTAPVQKESHEPYLQRVYAACQKNNPSAAQEALVQWAKVYFNQPLLAGLSDIIEQTDDQALIRAITGLEASRYSSHKQNWEGKELEKALQNFIAQQNKRNNDGDGQVLAELNP